MHGFLFFNLTSNNAGSSTSDTGIFTAPVVSCLAQASYMRCQDPQCASLTRNNVAQDVFSWDPINQRWSDVGAGGTGSQDPSSILTSYRPVVANGVKGLTHFSPDGVHDYIVPASFDEDVGSSISPTQQCGSVWMYTGNGWAKYQDCGWVGFGASSVKAFQISGEQYIVHTNKVNRFYDSVNFTTLQDQNYTQSAYIFKWSFRTQDNFGNYHPNGFFLTGGEQAGGVFSPSDAGYNPDFGNNGANVFQVRQASLASTV